MVNKIYCKQLNVTLHDKEKGDIPLILEDVKMTLAKKKNNGSNHIVLGPFKIPLKGN